MKLKNIQIKGLKPQPREYKVSDGKGLYILVKTTGVRYWLYKYRMFNKQKTLSIGVYPEVSLAEAREKHQAANKLPAQRIYIAEYDGKFHINP